MASNIPKSSKEHLFNKSVQLFKMPNIINLIKVSALIMNYVCFYIWVAIIQNYKKIKLKAQNNDFVERLIASLSSKDIKFLKYGLHKP